MQSFRYQIVTFVALTTVYAESVVAPPPTAGGPPWGATHASVSDKIAIFRLNLAAHLSDHHQELGIGVSVLQFRKHKLGSLLRL